MQKLRKFRTGDGYTFYMQPNGTMTDSPDPDAADMTFDSLETLKANSDVEEIFDGLDDQ